MTEKRFTIGDRALQEMYGGCIPAILDGGIPCNQSEVLKLLNELHEEVQSQSIVIKGYQERNDRLFKEKEQLRHEDINELSVIAMKYKALENENEQLKQQLNRLNTINEVKRETIKFHVDGYNRLKQTILEAYETERTELGKSVLKQLLEQLQ